MASETDFEYFDEEEDFLNVLAESAVQPYMFEPEYTQEELREREEQERQRDASRAAAPPEPEGPPRANNTDWCVCGHCQAMPSERESLCCNPWPRVQFLLEELPDTETACVTEHPSFSAHLDSGVLQTYFRIPKLNWKKQPKPNGPRGTMSLKQYRLAGYRHILEWILRGEKLGIGNRIVLPACIIHQVRQRFPEPSGVYKGFCEADDLFDELQ